jgi:maltose alpha-D-glucosyltransferase/alpha-amylase
VTAIWLLPFYPSPWKDDGYDISDYADVHPAYGSLSDFKVFLREAHQRGLRVITELVLNHTSDQHAWFQRARRAPAGSTLRDFYVWSDRTDRYKEARIIFSDFETSNWAWDPVAQAYYWHRFYSHQPDLNYDNPEVPKSLFKTVDFWLAMGVDGLRLDGVPYLYERENTNCENLEETYLFLKELRAFVDEKFCDRMLLAEANQWPEDAAAYFGDGDACHMAFHFPLMPRMFMALRMEDRYPILDILQQTPAIPSNAQWAVFLRNHDELTLEMVTDEERDYMYRMYAHDSRARINLGIRRRLAPLLGKDRKRIELMNALLFSLPGTPVVYYGDEIGMGDNIYLGDRNGVRTPMQWSADRNAGFSRANPQRLYLPIIIDPDYHYEVVNVDACQNNLHSVLWFMKRLIAQRKRFQPFGRGTLEFLRPENSKVLAFLRRHQEEVILVVANLSRFTQYCELDLSAFKGMVPIELFGQTRFPVIGDQFYFLTLGPHNFYWFSLERQESHVETGKPARAQTSVVVSGSWDSLFSGRSKSLLETLLTGYLQARGWSTVPNQLISSVQVQGVVPVGTETLISYLVFLQISYLQGHPEFCLLPCAVATGEPAEKLRTLHPDAVITDLVKKGVSGTTVLYEAIYEEAFRQFLLEAIGRRRRFKGASGEVCAFPIGPVQTTANQAVTSPDVSSVKVDRTNVSLIYRDYLVLRLFRQLAEGVHPDVEMISFLSERVPPPEAPQLSGVIEYRRRSYQPVTLGILQQFAEHHEDAWEYTLNIVGRFYERVLTTSAEAPRLPLVRESLLELVEGEFPESVRGIVGIYLETARVLGTRTAKLHLVLSAETANPRFTPEPFTKLYQRSIYQSMRNLTYQVLKSLRLRFKNLTEIERQEAERVLSLEERLFSRFQPLLGRKINAARIRIHGDYHLGHLRYTGKDFIIWSFGRDGSGQKHTKRSPLRDIASMIGSFHAAAYSALFSQVRSGMVRAEDLRRLESWAPIWIVSVSSSFLKAYLEISGQAAFLPPSREELGLLLNVYLLERFLQELNDELNSNGSDWTRITLKGISQVMETKL